MSVRLELPTIEQIRTLWVAQGGEPGTLPPLAGGAPGPVAPSSSTGGASGGSQIGQQRAPVRGSNNPLPPTNTVTIPLGGCGAVAGTEVASELLWRVPVYLPVSTTRWRLRIRNFNCCGAVEEAGAAPTLTAVSLGVPKWNAGRWKGALRGQAQQVLGSFAASNAADVFTPWVEGAGQQFTAYNPAAVTMGFVKPIGKWFLDECGGLLWSGAGSAAASVVQMVNPEEAFGAPSAFGAYDVRLEYEYVPAARGLGSLVGLAIGDSILGGYSLTDGGAYAAYETWATVAALRQAHPIMPTGPAGVTTSSYNNLASFRWTRLNLSTTTPSYAIISLGFNDIGGETNTLAQMEANITGLIAKLQEELGIPSVYLGTVLPAKLALAKEEKRVQFNNFLRTLPAGAQGVIDLDKQLALQAKPEEIDPTWGVNSEANGHVLRGAYQRMAGALILP